MGQNSPLHMLHKPCHQLRKCPGGQRGTGYCIWGAIARSITGGPHEPYHRLRSMPRWTRRDWPLYLGCHCTTGGPIAWRNHTPHKSSLYNTRHSQAHLDLDWPRPKATTSYSKAGHKAWDKSLRPYYNRRAELSLQEGCLLWGSRIVVQPQGHDLVMKLLHDFHLGISRLKSLA